MLLDTRRHIRVRNLALAAVAVGFGSAVPPVRGGILQIAVSNVALNTAAASPLVGVTLTYALAGDGLNVPGALQSVDIRFTSKGTVVKTISRLPGEIGAVAGANSVPLVGPDLPAPGTYTVSVTATSTACRGVCTTG
jgi:hypothetical protein